MTATLYVGDALGTSSRRAEFLPAFPAVERLDLLGNPRHSFADLRPTHGPPASGSPRFQVGIWNVNASVDPKKRNVAQLDGLNTDRVGAPRLLTGLCQRNQRFIGVSVWDNKTVSPGRGVQVAKLQEQIGLSGLNSEVGPQHPQHSTGSCGMNLPNVDRAAASPDVGIVDIRVTPEVFSEYLYGFWVKLLDRASRLVGRLFRVSPLARRDLVPVDVDPKVAIRIDDASHVRNISVHPPKGTTNICGGG